MSKLTSKEWWKQTGERALKTFCQTALTMLTVGQAMTDVNWVTLVSVSATAGVISVLTSVATLPDPEG